MSSRRNLNKSILELDPIESLVLIRNLRQIRYEQSLPKVRKKSVSKVRKKSVPKKKATKKSVPKNTMLEMMKSMPKDQLKIMLKKLEEKINEE